MNRLDRMARGLRKNLSKQMLVVVGFLALSALLVLIDSLQHGRPLLGIAAVLFCGAVAAIAWKTHTTRLAVRRLERRRPVAAPAPAPAPVAPVATPPAPPTGRPLAEKLTDIGTFQPTKASGNAAGRQAAAVVADPEAPFRLVAATQRTKGSARIGRALAVVASDDLVQQLSRHGTVMRLHPSMSAAEMAKADADVLVIEEAALEAGPWAGTLGADGGKLLLELRVAMAAMRSRKRPIYVVTTTGVAGLASAGLRADTLLVDDGLSAQLLSPGAPPSLLKTLATHRRDSKKAVR